MLVSQSPNIGERTSNKTGYQQYPELPRCGLRTDLVNSGLQYAVWKLSQGHGGQ